MTTPAPRRSSPLHRPDPATLSIEELRARLQEAESTIEAIRSGAVDAVIGNDAGSPALYSLVTADKPYRVLVEQMQEGAVMLASDQTIVFCNPRVAEIFACPVEEIVGRRLSDFVEGKDRESLALLFARSGGSPSRKEFTLAVPAGKVAVQISLKTLVQDGGGEQLTCGVISDLTRQRDVEARLNQAQKMEAVGQLTGGLAHDFNNLLQAISGNLQLVKRVPGDAVKVAAWAQNAINAVERGSRLTAQLLAFSRTQQIVLASVPVAPLMDGLADLFVRTLGKQIDVRFELCGDDVCVSCDATQLEMAILNLAINARDAMSGGGTLTISAVETAVSGDADLADGRYVRLDVRDTGAGMPSDVAARAFEPFFTTKGVGVGTGLGLAQVYGVCQQAKGIARITSSSSSGTVISLFLRQIEGTEETGPARAR